MSFFSQAGQAVKNWGQLGSYAARGGFGRTTAGALWGGAAGGLYGAMSSDTSVLGGMVAGAGLGAGSARYLGAGFISASKVGAGQKLGAHAKSYGQAFGRGVLAQAKWDYRGARMAANQGYNRIRGLGN